MDIDLRPKLIDRLPAPAPQIVSRDGSSPCDEIPPESQSFPQECDSLCLILRYRHNLATVALVAALISLSIAWLLPPVYTATTRLMPPPQSQSLASLLTGQGSGGALASIAQRDLGLKNPSDLYIGLLNSRSVQDGLAQQFDLQSVYRMKRAGDVREHLVASTRIQLTKEGLIAVSVEDRDPRRAADLANGYADQLRLLTGRLALNEAGERRQFFEAQVLQARQDLQQAELKLATVQQKTGILQIDAQSRVLIDGAAALRAQIVDGEVRLSTLRNFATEQNADVLQQEARLNGWRGELAKLESPRAGDPEFSKGRAPDQAREYAEAFREVRYREAVLGMLLRESEAARLDEAKEATIIQVVDVAIPPDSRSSPKRLAILVIGTLAAVLAAIGWLRLRHSLKSDVGFQLRWAQLRAEWRR